MSFAGPEHTQPPPPSPDQERREQRGRDATLVLAGLGALGALAMVEEWAETSRLLARGSEAVQHLMENASDLEDVKVFALHLLQEYGISPHLTFGILCAAFVAVGIAGLYLYQTFPIEESKPNK